MTKSKKSKSSASGKSNSSQSKSTNASIKSTKSRSSTTSGHSMTAKSIDLKIAGQSLNKYNLATYMVKVSAKLEPQAFDNRLYLNVGEDVKVKQDERSILCFTEQFLCNQLVNSIHKLASSLKFYEKTVNASSPDWIDDRAKVGEKIIRMSVEAVKYFKADPIVLQVSSPVYVIGNLHGNLRDLMAYKKRYWPDGPSVCTSNFIFLGGYIDRGEWSLECIVYLLCCKLLAPTRFYMLRSIHESRDMHSNFYQECKNKFQDVDKSLSTKVYEALNSVFDVMPLCAIVDNSIYCAQGGIPSGADKLDKIMAIKRPLTDPYKVSIALEILYNDPIHQHEYLELALNHDECKESATKLPPGYLCNLQRKKGCFFSPQAMDDFFAANSLTHMIRGQQCNPKGFHYHHFGKCTTIFSASYFGENANDAAIILLNDCKIRVIQVETCKKEDALHAK